MTQSEPSSHPLVWVKAEAVLLRFESGLSLSLGTSVHVFITILWCMHVFFTIFRLSSTESIIGGEGEESKAGPERPRWTLVWLKPEAHMDFMAICSKMESPSSHFCDS